MSSEIEKLERRWQENPLGLTFAPLAEAYRKAGDPARALELLDNGLTQHPNYVPAHIVRGRCHLDTQAAEAAEQAFRRVVELDPENVIALKSLADLAESEGRIAEARALLRHLLEVDRNSDDAREQLERLSVSSEPVEVPPEPGEFVARTFGPEQLEPAPSEDYHLAEEPVGLSDGEGRIPEIVLQEETLERSLPAAEAAQGRDALAAPDPDAAMGMGAHSLDPEPEIPEPVAEPTPEELAAVVETPTSELLESGWESVFSSPEFQAEDRQAEPEPAVAPPAETLEPIPEAEPASELPLEPSFEPSSEVPAEPEPFPLPSLEPVAEAEPTPVSAEPELMVTETMAEIFLRQGHRELALAVYTQLAQRDPSNDRVATAADRLKEALAPQAPPPAPPPPPEPEPQHYDAASTGGRSVGDWFAALLSTPRPVPAPAIHPPAFEARPSGEPTRPAADTLSLSAVFGEEAVPARPAGTTPPAGAAEPSFEQFFAAGEGTSSEVELPKAPGSETPALSSMAPEDLEQFNAWLRGLKR